MTEQKDDLQDQVIEADGVDQILVVASKMKVLDHP